MRTTIDNDLDFAKSGTQRPLSEDAKARLRRYDFEPSAANWDDVAHILIAPTMTVWQAWVETDDDAAMTGPRTDGAGKLIESWSRWPDRAAFRRAIFYATH